MPEAPAKDKNYNRISVLQESLQFVYQLETYAQDAEAEGDQELVDFFREAQRNTQQGADRAKEMLRERLQAEGG